MTIEEFNDTSFGAGMKAVYKGRECPVAQVCFEEKLFALDGVYAGADEPTWVRCESVTLV